jgi:hypothetical protein
MFACHRVGIVISTVPFAVDYKITKKGKTINVCMPSCGDSHKSSSIRHLNMTQLSPSPSLTVRERNVYVVVQNVCIDRLVHGGYVLEVHNLHQRRQTEQNK